MITVKKSKAVGRVKHTLVRASATLNVVPYKSKGKLTQRLRVPLRPGTTVSVVGRDSITYVSCKGVGGVPFFYAYKMNFSTFIDLGFTSSNGHKLLACLRGALRRDLDCGPRACRVRGRRKAMGCGTFLVTYNGTSRCKGGTCVTPRTSLASKLVSIAVLRPFAILSIPSLSFRLFGGAVSRGDQVGAFHAGGVGVRHSGPKIVRCSKSPVVKKGSVRMRLVPRKLGVVISSGGGRGRPFDLLRRVSRVFDNVGPGTRAFTFQRDRLFRLGGDLLHHLSGGRWGVSFF